jgi:hypothetical protein
VRRDLAIATWPLLVISTMVYCNQLYIFGIRILLTISQPGTQPRPKIGICECRSAVESSDIRSVSCNSELTVRVDKLYCDQF